MANEVCFYAQFLASAVGLNGLTVTWDIEQITRSTGARSALVTGGATNITVGRRGLYGYMLAGANLALYDYVATAITAGAADQKEIAALWTSYGQAGGEKDVLVDAIWDELLTAATHNVATSAARRLRTLGAMSITDGTASAGTANSITLEAGSSTTSNIYNENLITIVAGTGAGQCRMIAEYNGSTLKAIVDRPWDVTPNATSEYMVIAFCGILLTHHGLAAAGAASTITLASTASAINDVYVGSMIVLTTGTGPGQARLITAYDGATKIATVTPAWTTAPDATTVYKILPVGRSIVASMQDSAVDAILDDPVEGSTTLRQMLRLIAAALFGDMALTGSTATFSDLAASKTRITAALSSTARNVTALDGT